MQQAAGKHLEGHSEKLLRAKTWLAFFTYSVTVALFVQFILLPRWLPSIHAGDGLLAGGDWHSFHEAAVELSGKIRAQGWAVWQLRPWGQAPVGIAAALYALITPQPYVLIPLNAALHASAGLTLTSIVRPFVQKWGRALMAALPFLVYPSALAWVAQIHKDGFAVAGYLLFVYGWMGLCREELQEKSRLFRCGLTSIAGAALIWIVRPYVVQMLQVISVLPALLLTARIVSEVRGNSLLRRAAATAFALIWTLVVVLTPLSLTSIPSDVEPATPGRDGRHATLVSHTSRWRPSPWIPARVDTLLRRVAEIRQAYRQRNDGSLIDEDWPATEAADVLAFLPRAAQNAFLSPYPSQWFERGHVPGGTYMRRLAALEMAGVYLALPMLIVALWIWRRRLDLWIAFLTSSTMMTMCATAVPNVGTLHRMRYGYTMLLVALGIAGGFEWWSIVRDGTKVTQEGWRRPTPASEGFRP